MKTTRNEREQPHPLPGLDGDINEPLCRHYRNTPVFGAFKTVSYRVLELRGPPVALAEMCKGHIKGGGVLERARSMPKLASDERDKIKSERRHFSRNRSCLYCPQTRYIEYCYQLRKQFHLSLNWETKIAVLIWMDVLL